MPLPPIKVKQVRSIQYEHAKCPNHFSNYSTADHGWECEGVLACLKHEYEIEPFHFLKWGGFFVLVR